MLKLKQLQKQQQQQKEASTSTTPSTTEQQQQSSSNDASASSSGEGTGYVIKRTNSKELLKQRMEATQNASVFTLSKNRGGGRGKKGKVNAAELRVQKDVAELEEIPGVEVDFPDTNNLMKFNVKITPTEGLYKGATFRFEVEVPPSYPHEAPKAECKTLIYHPNIDWEGHVCLNILRADWKPVLTLSSVLFGLMTLFLEPNPDDPLNKEAAKLMIDKPAEFERNVASSLRGGWVLGRQFTKLI